MIILLDIEKQKLTLYGEKGIVNIPFAQAGSMYDYLDSDNVLYITNAIEVNADDILNMIKGMGIAVGEDPVQDTGTKYLHGTSEGTIFIDETMKFEGLFDCKPITQEMAQIIKNSIVLQGLIRNKKIEIIGERRRNKLRKEFKKSQEKQLEKQQLIDSGLDDMILKTKVADWDGTLPGDDHSDVIAVDIGGRGRVGAGGDIGPKFDTMSELLENIEGL